MQEAKAQFVSSIVFVKSDASIKDVVNIMRQKRISSILVIGNDSVVQGIVTERDIVWRISDLDVKEKMDRPVSSIMTRPVHFARLEYLYEDIRQLYLQHRIRHFPIIDGSDAKSHKVAGIMTVTDLFLSGLEAVTPRQRIANVDANTQGNTKETTWRHQIYLLSLDTSFDRQMHKIFDTLNIEVRKTTMQDLDMDANFWSSPGAPLIFDIDGFDPPVLAGILRKAKSSPRQLILLSSDHRLTQGLQSLLKDHHQKVLQKPVDISYLQWLILKDATA